MIRKILLPFSIVFFNAIAFAQGPVDGFYKGKGNAEIGIGGGASLNKNFYAGTDLIALKRNIVNVSIFAGVGLTENLDVYASLPFLAINDEKSLQDASVYLKYRLLNRKLSGGSLQLSLAAGFSSNLVDYQTEGGSALGQQAKVIDIRPVLHFASNSGWFYTLQGAYLYKFSPVPEAMNAGLKIGKATSNYYFDLWYAYQYSFGGLDYRGDPAPATFRELGVDYNQIGGTYYRPFTDKLGGYIGASYSFAGRNTVNGYGFNLGMTFKF
ncbi:hypothetical protein G3O08_11755 [Cryomorpha ignava]|uniref:Transporter n=1 Tax=Cryomorpha ignava TaxID=101383 RepID=A0A7K3WR75_9FLAO|nr:hypothetical protein [Cryomorpha ignava]NEN24177.1 hypothetical protein [Cryomorpha ignava]